MPPQKIVLQHNRAPGDTLVMTALVRDLALAHPGRYQIGVSTSAMDLWRHNPYVSDPKTWGGSKKEVRYLKMEYGRGLRDQNHETVHFLAYFHRDFERQTSVSVPLTEPFPDLHLSKEERDVPLVAGRYWVVLSGGKSDFTAKVWHRDNFQEVVDQLRARGLGVVQIGGNDPGHWHPELTGTLDLVGQTSLRDMIRVIKHADGVICGVTCAMHMSAALQRPCVVLAGGREAWWWEAYVRENKGLLCPQRLKVPHRFLHTIGLLDCCKHHGCWKNKVVALANDKSLCYHPVLRPAQPVPLCMDMITPAHVMDAVMSYYTDKSLPPIVPGPMLPPPLEVAVEQRLTPPAPLTAKTKQAALLGLFDMAEAKPEPKKPQANRVKVSVPTAALGLNPGAKLETRGKNHSTLVSRTPGTPAAITPGEDVFAHPDVGGKFTIFALFYGEEKFYDLHKACIESIVSTVPASRMDLRVGSNALNSRSAQLLNQLVERGIITKHYQHTGNDYKYPVMREMFYDPSLPITTKWVLWFDDDSIADRTPAWLNLLAQQIVQYHRRNNAHMFGAPFVSTASPAQQAWYESRPWHRKRPWRRHDGKPSPSGNRIHFCTGGFWALTHEAMVKCDIPDVDIGHNGGDITIGEQLYQGGFGMKGWNAKKQFVLTSSVRRRGATLPMPGTAGHVPPRLVRV